MNIKQLFQIVVAGSIYQGINRLGYDFHHEGGFFPVHVESNHDPQIARWL